MAGTINYLYDPGQTVWAITECFDGIIAVREGIVNSIRASILTPPAENVIVYNVKLQNTSITATLNEEDIFGNLSSAMIEYELRLQN